MARAGDTATSGRMVVLDASVVVEMLLGSQAGRRAMSFLLHAEADLHASELLDVEVLHVLRRAVSRQQLSVARANDALATLDALPLRRHGHSVLRQRVWQHRANLSAYDATYVALAEGLGAGLLTCDARLASAPGVAIPVQVI